MKLCTINMCLLPPFIVQKIGADHQKDQRLALLLNFLDEHDFDVVFLQEFYGRKDRETLRHHMNNNGYDMVCDTNHYNIYGLGLGLVILSKNDTLTDLTVESFPHRFFLERNLHIPRGMIKAVQKKSGIVLINTHLSTTETKFSWEKKDQMALQINKLDHFIPSTNKHVKWILGGDLNMEYDDPRVQKTNFYKYGYASSILRRQPSMNSSVPFFRNHDLHEVVQDIDHVFASFPILSTTKEITLPLSDHFPVIVTIDSKCKKRKVLIDKDNYHKDDDNRNRNRNTQATQCMKHSHKCCTSFISSLCKKHLSLLNCTLWKK